jgi:hypothetical protein
MPMTEDVTHTIECSKCGAAIPSSADASAPCPACGEFGRLHRVGVVDVVALSAEVSFGLRGKSAETYRGTNGTRRSLREQYLTVGRSADGVRRRAHRVFDRDADVYEEVVTEEGTGWVVRHVREPVSAHRGRGSAKKRVFPDACSWAMDSIDPADRPSSEADSKPPS